MAPRHEYLTRAESADYLGISLRTLERWLSDGVVQGRRAPGTRTVRIRRADLDAIMEAA